MFQFGPADTQEIDWFVATDPKAQVSVITGAWAIGLFRLGIKSSVVRKEAARLQSIEAEHLKVLHSPWTKARVRIWSLAEFIEDPMNNLQQIMDDIAPGARRRLGEAPVMNDLTGFGAFLQSLKNQGMNPSLAGDFPVDPELVPTTVDTSRPYLVKK